MCRNCLLRHVIGGMVAGRIEKGRRGRRGKHLLNDLEENIRYYRLKDEALGRSLWRTLSGRSHGPVVRQTA